MSVVIIDPATGGVAGLYLEAYKKAVVDYDVELVGAYSSVSKTGRQFFYRRTDLANAGRERFGALRLPLRYLELVVGLVRCLLLIARVRPKAVFYALSSNLVPELLFVLMLRLFRVRVYVICHDVIPFVGAWENRTIKHVQRRQFYRLADRLICHNRRSLQELHERYGISAKKLDYLPFPLMDLRPLARKRAERRATDRATRFLFIGHMRAEKGVNLLIAAWRAAATAMLDATLLIAGQVPGGEHIGPVDDLPTVTVLNRYIGEQDYVDLIAEADVVVLPYVAGTNSGVLSNVVSLGKAVIVSDIPMFRDSGLVDEASCFVAGDVAALAEKLASQAQAPPEARARQIVAAEHIRDRRNVEFAAALRGLLARIETASR